MGLCESVNNEEAKPNTETQAAEETRAIEPAQPAKVSKKPVKTAEEAVEAKQQKMGLDPNACTADQREHLRSVFTSLDTDGSGFLVISELQKFNKALPDSLFEQMDSGCKDGRVGLDEFMAYWESAVAKVGWDSVKKGSSELLVKTTGKEVDYAVNKKQLIEEMRESWTARAQRKFDEIDKDKDGQLTSEEFQEWATKNQDAAKLFVPSLDVASGFDKLLKKHDQDWDWSLNSTEFADMYIENMATSFLKTD